jgi:hypothetical protein
MTSIRKSRISPARRRPLPRTPREAAREVPSRPVHLPGSPAPIRGTVQATDGFRYLPPAAPLPGPSAPLNPFDSLLMLLSAGIIEPISRGVDLILEEPRQGGALPSVWYRA